MLHAIPYALNDRLYMVVHECCHPGGLSTEVSMPAFDVDSSNKIAMWNMHMTDLSGFTEDDVVGLSFFDLFGQDTLPNLHSMVTRSHEEVGPSTCRVCFHTIAGVPKMVQLTAVAFRDTFGQVIITSIVMETLTPIAEVPAGDSVDDMLSFTSDESDVEL